MIHPTKADRGRSVTYRHYTLDAATQRVTARTVTGKLVGIDRMLVSVAFDDPKIFGNVNRVDLCWVTP